MGNSPDRIKPCFNQLSFILQGVLFLLLINKPVSSTAQASIEITDSSSNRRFTNWARTNAFPIQNTDRAKGSADLEPLKKIIRNARIVALGEPAHGIHTLLALRNRMFRFLVENLGFTTIVLEAGFAESYVAADFIAGGPGTAQEAAAKLTIGSPSLENVALLQWMRHYNANPAHKHRLKFYGMDMQLRGFPGDTTPSHAAIDEALRYLRQVSPEDAVKLESAIVTYLPRLSVAKYPLLSSEEHNSLSATLDDLIALFERERINFINSSSKNKYEWAYRNAILARQTDRIVRVTSREQPGKISPDAWKAMNARDAAMTDNLIWILNSETERGKVLVVAHNAHVKNEVTTGGVWDSFAKPPNSMGQYLKSIFPKNDVFIIGSSCTPSLVEAHSTSLDRALLQVGKPRFILDLKPASRNPYVSAWLKMRRPMEANKVSYLMLCASDAFDGLLFINEIR
ncbi:erythromycin esterase family protein [Arcticibacter sp.]|uniref:erythromycin esterase family protein n=1 Tax=Arcticibacter sp. TaxID=1872630 RepID=UPI00388EF645